MRLFIVALAFLFSASAASAAPEIIYKHIRDLPIKFVASGGHVILWEVSALKPDCSSNGNVTFRITRKPRHGRLHIARTRIFPQYPRGNVRSACNGRPVSGERVTYVSRRGYAGLDIVEFETIYPAGREFLVRMGIEVR